MRNINLVIIVQDTTIQYQILGVGVIVFMIKRTKRARKVISNLYKNGFQKIKGKIPKYQIIANCKHFTSLLSTFSRCLCKTGRIMEL